REINAAGENDEGHAHRGNAQKGIVGEEIAEHACRKHVGELHHRQGIGDDEDERRGKKRTERTVHFLAPAEAGRRRDGASREASGDWIRRTMKISPALTMRLNSGGKPETRMPVFIAWMMSAPTTASGTEKRPPRSEVPPMTTARMASSSSQRPALLA